MSVRLVSLSILSESVMSGYSLLVCAVNASCLSEEKGSAIWEYL